MQVGGRQTTRCKLASATIAPGGLILLYIMTGPPLGRNQREKTQHGTRLRASFRPSLIDQNCILQSVWAARGGDSRLARTVCVYARVCVLVSMHSMLATARGKIAAQHRSTELLVRHSCESAAFHSATKRDLHPGHHSTQLPFHTRRRHILHLFLPRPWLHFEAGQHTDPTKDLICAQLASSVSALGLIVWLIMQPQMQTQMQKTWSNDSLSQVLRTTTSMRHPPVDVDRPRKHARRTSLPVRGDRAGPSAANGDGSRYSVERKRFRDAFNNGRPSRRATERRESMPDVSRAMDRLGRRSMFGVGEEGDDEEEDGEEEEAVDTDEIAASTIASQGQRSALESSTTYAAGPSSSGGRRVPEDASSSDASSSERHQFDWDVPNRRSTSIPPANLPQVPLSGRGLDDGPANLSASPRRRSYQAGANGRDVSTPPTLTSRRTELKADDGQQAASTDAPGRIGQMGMKGGSALNGNLIGGGRSPGMSSTPQKKQRRLSDLIRKSFPTNTTIEAGLLVLASVVVAIRLGEYPDVATQTHAWELMSLVIASSLFFLFGRESNEQGSIWATSLRQYRTCGDDGFMCGLLLGPLLGVTCLFASLEDRPAVRYASGDGLPFPPWRVESPALMLGTRLVPHPTMTALTLSRCTLLSLQTAMSTTLLGHLVATKWIRKPEQIDDSSWRRLWSYVKFAVTLSGILTLMREAFAKVGIPLWTDLTRGELLTSTLFYQINLYTIAQLARRSFTLGELSIVACVGVTLAMETLNLTTAKLMPGATPFVKTFRRPTPLLIFQLALVVGTFMIGFLLSPLLYLSRHLAQKPVHRLRWPHKRDLHRRLLAFFFYLFATVYVVGALGFWVYWLLGWQNPWTWILRFVVSGRRWWSRPLLVTFWVALVSTSIAGWQATVLNGKRFRVRATPHATHKSSAVSSSVANHHTAPLSRLGLSTAVATGSAAKEQGEGVAKAKNLTASTSGDLSASANPLFPKRAAYLSLNARRKFFHALAVLLFAPGIAFDPAFTHLAFSLAFSVFIFAEYIRYYALYPFGATLHVFMSEFTDHKDSGPVILSHFYLLTGCAGGLWIEGLHGTSTKAGMGVAEQIVNSVKGSQVKETLWTTLLGSLRWYEHQDLLAVDLSSWSKGGDVDISMFIGVLTLGVGDALASIVGRRYGRIRWPASGKTLEGSLAFVTSIFASAVFLRAIGWCAPFSVRKMLSVRWRLK